jgi:hypothetical protein
MKVQGGIIKLKEGTVLVLPDEFIKDYEIEDGDGIVFELVEVKRKAYK